MDGDEVGKIGILVGESEGAALGTGVGAPTANEGMALGENVGVPGIAVGRGVGLTTPYDG